MHYLGQTHTVAVPLPVTCEASSAGIDPRPIRAAFERAYPRSSAAYCRIFRCGSCRCAPRRSAAGRISISPRSRPRPECRSRPHAGQAPVWFAGAWHADRDLVAARSCRRAPSIEGPAILEQPDATTVIDPGLVALVDDLGNLIIETSRDDELRRHDRTACYLRSAERLPRTRDGAYGRARTGRRRDRRDARAGRSRSPISCARGAGGSSRRISRLCRAEAASRIISPHLKTLRPFLPRATSRRELGPCAGRRTRAAPISRSRRSPTRRST